MNFQADNSTKRGRKQKKTIVTIDKLLQLIELKFAGVTPARLKLGELGAEMGDRTPDLLFTKQLLYH
jgi:hypothetical protein